MIISGVFLDAPIFALHAIVLFLIWLMLLIKFYLDLLGKDLPGRSLLSCKPYLEFFFYAGNGSG
jgi:hypothetical protein